MRRRLPTLVLVVAFLLAVSGSASGQVGKGGRPEGLVTKEQSASAGYTLYSPLEMERTYLVDLDGKVAHTWRHDTQPGLNQYLLEDGTLVRAGRLKLKGPFENAKGQGGRVEALDWDGTVLWRFDYASDQVMQHHDVEPLPNGNVLFLAWERKRAAEALAAGRDPKQLPEGEVWPDTVIEYDPRAQQIVWTWSVWDHLIQDHDPTKANYGDVAAHPEKIDVNYAPVGDGEADWNHANSIDYNPALDQIMISLRSHSELWIIDHGVSAEEARGPAGDLLFRTGNPANYGKGKVAERELFAQHDAQWITDGLTNAGSILVFNNGVAKTREYSTVDEITPVIENGRYAKDDNGVYAASTKRVYPNNRKDRDFAAIISGTQRLPNGNTLITYGTFGRTFEVDPDGRLVWDYVNPHFTVRKDTPTRNTTGFEIKPWWIFQAERYAPDHPGLARLTGARGT
jgi:Arylsulfotransferase (ASST)